MKFQYSLSYNESEERYEEGTANFKFPLRTVGILDVQSFEEAVDELKRQFNHLINANDCDWECDEAGLNGTFRFQNCEDGLAVEFEVEAV